MIKKLIITLTVALFTCVPNTYAAFEFTTPCNESSLNAKLKGGACTGKARVINEAAKKFNVDAKLLAAIIGEESGWGKKGFAKSNLNYCGIRFTKKYHDFHRNFKDKSLVQFNAYKPEDRCIYYTAYLISTKYRRCTLEQMAKKYCGSTKWATHIRNIKKSL